MEDQSVPAGALPSFPLSLTPVVSSGLGGTYVWWEVLRRLCASVGAEGDTMTRIVLLQRASSALLTFRADRGGFRHLQTTGEVLVEAPGV